MKKKILSLLLTGAMAVSMLAGCGNSEETNNTGSTETGSTGTSDTSEEELEKPVDDLTQSRDITVWLYKDDYKIYYESYDENPAVQYLNDKFNCSISFQQPAKGSESDQFSLMIGTGSYTDVMEISYSTEGVTTLYADGVIQDLAPYLETYAPNFYSFINKEENADVRKALYDEEGHLFTIPMGVNMEDTLAWGGMVYRRDILETMTGGYVSFPSGNEEPSTVDDMEYMLELYTQYFAAAGFADSAGLILPYTGYLTFGDLLNGFGTAPSFYVEDGTVKYGPVQEGYYNYLVKMNEWYEKGYIYQDFASRTNDVFYVPNTSLTYGGAAGIWYGLTSQLGDAMSMPEYNLIMEVNAMAAPLDTENGVKEALGYMGIVSDRAKMNTNGYVVSSACSEENLIRWLTVCDYLFTEEGGMLRVYGLTADQGADENPIYQKAGIDGGAYTYDGTEFKYNEKLQPSVGELSVEGSSNSFIGARLPGLNINEFEIENSAEEAIAANDIWKTYGSDNNYPQGITFNAEDNNTASTNSSAYSDYLNSMVPKFIMGTEVLNEDTWKAFVKQMNALGVDANTAIYQQYYDNFNAK